MSVSVVIPSFNRLRWLKQTLGSYRAARAVYEIIVVDDGSADGTGEFVLSAARDDRRIRLVRHERNRGLPAARNSGIDAARSELICFGEDDVVFESDYVDVLVRHLDEQGADIIAGPRPLIERYESRRQELRDYVARSSMRIPWICWIANCI